jgi:peptidoglycan-associated lipoprotein
MKKVTPLFLLALGLVATGCATKKYVGQEVKTVNDRVDTVQGQVEETQNRITKHDETLNQHGTQIQQNTTATQQASKTAQEALDRATAAGKLAEGKLLYEVALTDDQVRFAFNKAGISPEGEKVLGDLATRLKDENKNVYIEIQGHTDNVGSEDYNNKLGLDRAEAVRRYLNAQGVPLHAMSVISYGETSPVTDNKTRESRAQNRRVVIAVLQ